MINCLLQQTVGGQKYDGRLVNPVEKFRDLNKVGTQKDFAAGKCQPQKFAELRRDFFYFSQGKLGCRSKRLLLVCGIEAEGAFGVTSAGKEKGKLDRAFFPQDRTKVPERGKGHGRNPKC
jgi:hypothetical protein